MKIDERGLQEVEEVLANAGIHPRAAQMIAMKCLEAYLAALPSAEPGRDRIAVVVDEDGDGMAEVYEGRGDPLERVFERIEDQMLAYGKSSVHFARAIVRCNLPRPTEPVEVEGSVEEVG